MATVPLVALLGCGGKIRATDENESTPTTTTTTVATDALVITPQVATGANHACRLGSDGVIKCWGQNGSGQLGRGTISNSEEPGAVSLNEKAIAFGAGIGHTCALVATGAVWCWGDNQQGQIGATGTIVPGVPTEVKSLPPRTRALAVGDSHTCALTEAGGVRCWGHAAAGQLGDGTSRFSSSDPLAPQGLSTGVTAIAAGTRHTCALLDGGAIRCWGENAHGTLGDDTAQNSNVPIVASAAPANVAELSLGTERTCARTSEGAVYCWGRGTEGELGDGSRTNSQLPVLVRGIAQGAVRVATGAFQTCALMAGGTVSCWGWQGFGAVTDAYDSPVAIDIAGVANVAVGAGQACALLRDETVRCWGSNYAGALGGTAKNALTPVRVEL